MNHSPTKTKYYLFIFVFFYQINYIFATLSIPLLSDSAINGCYQFADIIRDYMYKYIPYIHHTPLKLFVTPLVKVDFVLSTNTFLYLICNTIHAHSHYYYSCAFHIGSWQYVDKYDLPITIFKTIMIINDYPVHVFGHLS